jgi:hypothetical protein
MPKKCAQETENQKYRNTFNTLQGNAQDLQRWKSKKLTNKNRDSKTFLAMSQGNAPRAPIVEKHTSARTNKQKAYNERTLN